MKGQPFEPACRGGSLLVSESRVMRRGNVAWALWRSQITGVGCVCPNLGEDVTAYLHLRDGRRFAVEEIAPRECFQLFELLGYEPERGTPAGTWSDDAPLVIDLGDGHTRVVAKSRSVTLEQDHKPLWSVSDDELLGTRVTAGAVATSVELVVRNGASTSLGNVPFTAALRLLAALGAAPAEIAEPAPPATPMPAPTATPAAAPTPASRTTVPPPSAESVAHDEHMKTPVEAVTCQQDGPARSEKTTFNPAQSSKPTKRTRTGPRAATVVPRPRQVREAPLPPHQERSTRITPTARTRHTASARRTSIAVPAVKQVTQASAGSQQGPATRIDKQHEPGAEAAERLTAPAAAAAIAAVTPPAAPALPALPAAPPPTSNLRPRSPSPLSTAAAFQAQSQSSQGGTPDGASTLHAPERRREAESWDAGVSVAASAPAPTSGNAVTAGQSALLLWQAALAAVALRLAGWRETVTGALARLGALRRQAGLPPDVAAEAAHGILRPRQWIASPRLAVGFAWIRGPQTVVHRAGVRAAAMAAAVGSAGRDALRATRPGRGLAGVRLPAVLAGSLGSVPARGASTHMRTGLGVLRGALAARWRRLAFAIALGLAVVVAGTAMTSDSTSAAVISAGAIVHGQGADLLPSRGVASSTAHASVIYVGSQDGAIYALDASSGTLLWRYDTGSQVEGGPALMDGVIYAGEGDGSIVALQAATHRELWRYRTGGIVRAAPAVADGVVYAGSSDHHLYALRASDGALLWKFAAGDWFAGTPAVTGSMVYAGSYDGTLYALRASDGTEVWHLTTSGEMAMAPLVVNGVVYAGSSDNSIYALDARTGAIRWRYRTGGSIYAPPVVQKGVVYVGSCDTNLYALRASDGKLLWRAPTGGLVLASAVVVGQVVYVGTADGTLDALAAGDGALRWRYAADDTSSVVPTVVDGAVYGSSGNNSIFALDAQDGALRWSYRTNGRISTTPTVAHAP